jgi:hypothetical protein
MSKPGGKVVLHARGVEYYSANDEAAFFEWLDKEGYSGGRDVM